MNFQEFIAKTTPGTPAGKLTDQIFNNRTLNAEILALYNNSWGDFDVNATAGGNIFKVNNKTTTNVGLNQQMNGIQNFKVNNKTTTNVGLNQQMNGIQNIMNYQEQNTRESMYKKQISSLYASASLGYKHTYYLEGTIRGDKSSTLPTNNKEQNTRESMYKKQISSLYASASLGYKHTYYLEGTIRGDKSSTLPTNNNTYVYPSVSGSLVFTEFIKNKKFINYGKIRASWAKVGSDTDPYLLALNYTTGKYSYSGYTIGMIANSTQPNNYGKIRASWAKVGSDTDPYLLALNYTTGKYSYSGYTIGMIANSTQPNKDLKPTMTGSYEVGLEMKFLNGRLGLDATYYNQNEVGLEMKFLNGRLGLDATYYNQNSKDQILSLASTTTSGYDYRLINAGEIQNQGVEIALNARPLQIKDFAWDLGVNFSKHTNKVKSLTDGREPYSRPRPEVL